MKKKIKELKELILSFPQIVACEGEEKCYSLLSDKLKELTLIRESFTPEQDKEWMLLFQKELLHIIHKSTFAKYVYDKPRGYSGDFIVQEMIWRGITKGDEYRYLGETELGKLLTALSFKMENPMANINRINYIRKEVCNCSKMLASIGCGSCLELWDLKEGDIQNKRFFLLDQDDTALKRAMNKIPVKLENVIYIRENVLRFIVQNKKSDLLGQRDLIYLFGLLDYFPVNSSRKILKALWNSVAPGGRILVTNAHPRNPTRLWMEYVGEWFLEYKNEDEMYSLVDGLNEIKNINFLLGSYGIYQYLEVTKKN